MISLTPYRRIFDGEIESLFFSTYDGSMEVLAGHEPMVAPIVPCVLRFSGPDGEKILAASEGFATIRGERLEIFLDAAEWPVEIDRKRASDSLERAEKRLVEGAMSWELSRAKSAADRARARLAALRLAAENRAEEK